LSPWLKACNMPADQLMELGRGLGDEVAPPFDMTAFVLRHATAANAVSRLHGETANATWATLRPEPISAITNGVHAATWIGRPLRRLFERPTARSLGSDAPRPEVFDKLSEVLESDLWGAHRQQKRELIEFMRSRLARQFARRGGSPTMLREPRATLHPAER